MKPTLDQIKNLLIYSLEEIISQKISKGILKMLSFFMMQPYPEKHKIVFQKNYVKAALAMESVINVCQVNTKI